MSVQFPASEFSAGLALGLSVAVSMLRVGCPRGGPLHSLRPVGVVGGVAGVEHLGFVSWSVTALHQCVEKLAYKGFLLQKGGFTR